MRRVDAAKDFDDIIKLGQVSLHAVNGIIGVICQCCRNVTGNRITSHPVVHQLAVLQGLTMWFRDEDIGFMSAIPAKVIWNDGFLNYQWSPTHWLNPIRLELTLQLATELGVLSGIDLHASQPAQDRDLERIHRSDYVAAVKTAAERGPNARYGLLPPDNPPFPGMHEAATLIVGGTLLAAQHIATGHTDRVINLAGGLHHALAEQASGFCIYNDCAIAISWLLDHGVNRIAYLDVDVHHGDGAQAAFYDDPRVLTISPHQHPWTQRLADLAPESLFPQPWATASIHVINHGKGKALNLSISLSTAPVTRSFLTTAWTRMLCTSHHHTTSTQGAGIFKLPDFPIFPTGKSFPKPIDLAGRRLVWPTTDANYRAGSPYRFKRDLSWYGQSYR